MGEVKSVLKMTMMMIVEKIWSGMTFKLLPVMAKIKPTSPRGTMPKPTTALLTLPAASCPQ